MRVWLGHFENITKSETDKTWRKKMYANLTILITEVTGYPFVHIVPNNPGLMVITNVDKKINSIVLSRQKCLCSYRDRNTSLVHKLFNNRHIFICRLQWYQKVQCLCNQPTSARKKTHQKPQHISNYNFQMCLNITESKHFFVLFCFSLLFVCLLFLFCFLG